MKLNVNMRASDFDGGFSYKRADLIYAPEAAV